MLLNNNRENQKLITMPFKLAPNLITRKNAKTTNNVNKMNCTITRIKTDQI